MAQKGALSTAEVCEALGLSQMKNRRWHVQGAVAIRGEGLYEGLDWCAALSAASLSALKWCHVTMCCIMPQWPLCRAHQHCLARMPLFSCHPRGEAL